MNMTAWIRRLGFPFTLALTASLCTSAFAVETERVSTSLNTPAVDVSDVPSVSYDASRVVFESRQPGLVDDDTNGTSDIFMFERRSKRISLVSVSSEDEQATGPSYEPEISGNGQFVVYHSNAGNLVNNDSNDTFDAFIFNINTATTQLLSVNLNGNAGDGFSHNPDITTDGGIAVFESNASDLVESDTNGEYDIFVRNLESGVTQRIPAMNGTEPNGSSFSPAVSENGRYVAFQSLATNLLSDEDDAGINANIYLRDLLLGTTELVSRGINGAAPDGLSQSPVISRQGRYVAFTSMASNLVEGDGNSSADVFRYDRFRKEVVRVSTNFEGGDATSGADSPSLSADGALVTFASGSPDILESPSVFQNLVYQKDMDFGDVRLVSLSSDGELADAGSFNTATDRSGRYVAYTSTAQNLDGVDANPLEDVYLTDQGAKCDVGFNVNKKTVDSGQWIQLSLPCQPPEGLTVSDLFGDDIAGDYGTTWIVFTYDVVARRYVDPGAEGRLSAGIGFWFQQLTGAPVTLDLPVGSRGLPSNFDDGVACISSAGCRSVELSGNVTGDITWQMAGNPFQQSRILSVFNLRFQSSAGFCSQALGCTLNGANSANLINQSLPSYDGEQYINLTGEDTIDAWTGFWIGELPGADSNAVRIVYAEGTLDLQQ